MSDVKISRWRVTQEQFNKGCAAIYASLITAVCVWTMWLIGDSLNFIQGVIAALMWMQTYRTCGGDPLNYPGDRTKP